MINNNIVIREIEAQDNTQIELVIKNCFLEFKIPLEGTAYTDVETTQMYESYQGNRESYFVVAKNSVALGGGGIKPLNDYKGEVCELQKMYFSPEIRGKGQGKKLFEQCLEFAEKSGYKHCYIESASQLKAAIHIYEGYGFKHLNKALGNTGHYACGVWMLKTF